MTALPDGLLAAWYGDDFTGAAATMEVFAFAGLEAVLFFDVPTQAQLARFPKVRGIGIAGVARSKPPAWMRQNLPRIFRFLAGLDAPLSFYKVCSTFDSAPDVGSIGCASDLAAEQFGASWMPMLVAAPPIGRWQAFGNLFATAPGGTYRLDQHPVMSKHPVTPMKEANLQKHLSEQTGTPTGLVDLRSLLDGGTDALEDVKKTGARIVSIDVVDDRSLAAAGALIWHNKEPGQFAVGSQGVLYALVAHWRDTGALVPEAPLPSAGHSEKMIVVSGSASAVTAAQIDWASQRGFAPIRFDARRVVDRAELEAEEQRCLTAALELSGQGHVPLVYSAKGPEDPAIQLFEDRATQAGLSMDDARERIGSALGRILKAFILKTKTRRAVISGGDTSGHAANQLGVFALTVLAPTIPAAALCKAHSEDPAFDGLELALKGGQMGEPDYFCAIQAGGGAKT